VKGLLALGIVVVAVLLGLSVAGCGSARNSTGSRASGTRSAQYTPSAKLGGVTPALAAAVRRGLLEKAAWVKSTPQFRLPNDGDHDEPGDADRDNRHDTGTQSNPGSVDPYLDYLPPAANTVYHDEDDEQAVRFGHAASASQARAVTALVKRYYAVAATGDGAKACTMLLPSFAKAVPLEYGKYGPSYLHGGKTCAGVMTRLFAHARRELAASVQVTNVRVSGPTALAFLGSKKMRASSIVLHRQGSGWRIAQVLGSTLQ
jgi:hypothetical protein